jgi:hypothetical protein
MDSYYCIVSTHSDPVADLVVLQAATDGEALARAHEIATAYPRLAQLFVFFGERNVATLRHFQRAA